MATTGADRLRSLDVFRGAAVAGMLLVNNPGSWGAIYPPLRHAAWHGCTPTDLVFPFFLFIVGVAMMCSFPKRLAQGASRRALYAHVVRRAVALILLGYWGGTFSAVVFPGDVGAAGIAMRAGYVASFAAAIALLAGRVTRRRVVVFSVGAMVFAVGAVVAGGDDALLRRLARLRLPGVLVRIGVCYACAAAIYFLAPRWRALSCWAIGLLAVYWIWMVYVPVPGFGPADLDRGFPDRATPADALFSNWCFWIDHHVLGEHVWGARKLRDASGRLIWSFDPEGLLSTLPAIATVLFGMLAGAWLRRDRSPAQRVGGLVIGGGVAIAGGLLVAFDFPVNKRLWTSSYVLYTAGIASVALAVVYWIVDVLGWRRWSAPFVWFGMNAITAFVGSGMLAQILGRTGWKRAIMQDGFGALFADRANASLAFALAFVALWALVMWALYRRRIFLKL